MKKLINLLIVAITALCLVGCTDNTGNTDGPGTGNTETPINYPYMDFFENDVYAMKFLGNGDIGQTHGTFRDKWFAAVGKSGMADVTKSTPHSFNDKDYGGLCFTAKTGIELNSVTFTIVAEKECYIGIRLYGPKLDENGNPGFNNTNDLKTINSVVQYKNGNYTTQDGTKLIKLSPNKPMTFTVDTLAEAGELTSWNEVEDFGKITNACADDDTTRRFLLSVLPYHLNDNWLGSQYTYNEFVSAEFGIRLYNISFDVVKL